MFDTKHTLPPVPSAVIVELAIACPGHALRLDASGGVGAARVRGDVAGRVGDRGEVHRRRRSQSASTPWLPATTSSTGVRGREVGGDSLPGASVGDAGRLDRVVVRSRRVRTLQVDDEVTRGRCLEADRAGAVERDDHEIGDDATGGRVEVRGQAGGLRVARVGADPAVGGDTDRRDVQRHRRRVGGDPYLPARSSLNVLPTSRTRPVGSGTTRVSSSRTGGFADAARCTR